MRTEIPYLKFIRTLVRRSFIYPLIMAIVATIIFLPLPAQWFNFLPDSWLHPGVGISKIPHKISVFMYILYAIFLFSVLHCLFFVCKYRTAKDSWQPAGLVRKIGIFIFAFAIAWFWKFAEIDHKGAVAKWIYYCQDRSNQCSHHKAGGSRGGFSFMFADDVDRAIYPLLFYPLILQTFLTFMVAGMFGRVRPPEYEFSSEALAVLEKMDPDFAAKFKKQAKKFKKQAKS